VSAGELSLKNEGEIGVKLSTHLSVVTARDYYAWRFTSASAYAIISWCFNEAQGELVPF
jgi:hypothetical protein